MDSKERGLIEHTLNSGSLFPVHREGNKGLSGVYPIDRDSYYEYRCPDAETFLKILDVQTDIHQLPANGETRAFYYRGHRDADWSLCPSIFRSIPSAEHDDIVHFNGHVRAGIQEYELQPYCNFLEAVNSQGAYIENDAFQLLQIHRRGLHETESWPLQMDSSRLLGSLFPSAGQMRTLALAQHYGVATRLLDWSRNPYIALFFAAAEICSPQEVANGPDFGVWMIPKILFEITKKFKYLDILDISSFQNANISAQQGLFTSHIPSFDSVLRKECNFPITKDGKRFMHLDEYLSASDGDELHERLLNEVTGKPMLLRLKSRELGLIRKKLDQLGINWATIMPNLDGAAKEANRRDRMVRIV